MTSLKMKGDLAELKVATDLLERGYKIAIPYGEDWDFDLIFSRGRRPRASSSQVHPVER
jgi:PD-(D/E)XK endonuclease